LPLREVGPGGKVLHQPTHTNRNKFIFPYVSMECDLLRDEAERRGAVRILHEYAGAKVCREIHPYYDVRTTDSGKPARSHFFGYKLIPMPQAPILNRQTRKVANANVRNS